MQEYSGFHIFLHPALVCCKTILKPWLRHYCAGRCEIADASEILQKLTESGDTLKEHVNKTFN